MIEVLTGGWVDIGTLNERSLHAALKSWYVHAGDQIEVPVDGFIVDIVRGETLIEIQTSCFSSMKKKLLALVGRHRVRLVYPVARDKWIVKVPDDKWAEASRRKSPKHGQWVDVFDELVSFPQLMLNSDFSLDVLLIEEDEIWRRAKGRAWRRRGWCVEERRLLGVIERRLFEEPEDLLDLLPDELGVVFTTAEIAKGLRRPRRLAQKAAYCLREMGMILPIGKKGNAILYARRDSIGRNLC